MLNVFDTYENDLHLRNTDPRSISTYRRPQPELPEDRPVPSSRADANPSRRLLVTAGGSPSLGRGLSLVGEQGVSDPRPQENVAAGGTESPRRLTSWLGSCPPAT